MTGADEAHYLTASNKIARLIHFPDGISRHIVLTAWQWEVFDKLLKNKGWKENDLPDAAYELALEGMTFPDDFEKQIRTSFELFIRANMHYVMDDAKTSSNDEY